MNSTLSARGMFQTVMTSSGSCSTTLANIITFDRCDLIGAPVADEKQTDQAADLPIIITYKNSNITEIVTRTDTKFFR